MSNIIVDVEPIEVEIKDVEIKEVEKADIEDDLVLIYNLSKLWGIKWVN